MIPLEQLKKTDVESSASEHLLESSNESVEPNIESNDRNYTTLNIAESKRFHNKLNSMIVFTVATLFLLTVILSGFIIVAVYTQPLIEKIDKINFDNFQNFINKFQNRNFDSLFNLTDRMQHFDFDNLQNVIDELPDLMKTAKQFQSINVTDLNKGIRLLGNISTEFHNYEQNISVIIDYLKKFDKLLE